VGESVFKVQVALEWAIACEAHRTVFRQFSRERLRQHRVSVSVRHGDVYRRSFIHGAADHCVPVYMLGCPNLKALVFALDPLSCD